jgi:periplasmic protein TonB
MDSKRSDRLTEPRVHKQLGVTKEHEFKLRNAILLSLLLHIVAYLTIPTIKHTPLPEPIRFEIEIASQAGQQVTATKAEKQQQEVVKQLTPVEEKKVVQPPKKAVTKKQKPVLTTESEEASDQVLVETLDEPVPPTDNNAPVKDEAPNEKATAVETEAAVADAETSSNQVDASSSASTKATKEVSEAEIWGGYGQKLYEMVGNNKRYPPIAIRRSWEGDVSVVAKFIEGVLVDVTLLKSSGRKVLDDESMRMVKEAIEKTPITGNLVGKDFSVTIPVNFELY